tara:strand:- start:1733 stop:5140 length:3408 start_codon:yes stop_codon:yes gene_type:complete
MQKYKVNIAEGVSEIVEAENPEEARQKVKAQIAKGAISPFYDKLYFDYETGVNYKGLRSKLGRAETSQEKDKVLRNLFDSIKGVTTAEDQESVMENKVGNEGFTRNTKGQLAITPKGLEELGLDVQQKTLADGSVIDLNTIIDEKGATTGDFADFSGIAGPIIGALTFLSPQARVINGLRALLGGNRVLANMFASGTGSAVGKAAEEEIFDTQQGFQLQDRDDLNKLYGTEFALGSIGQGIGEGIGGAYGLILGRKAPQGDVRLLAQGNKGRVVTDVMALDRRLGRDATEKEIKAAIKKGEVNMLDYKFIPSQQTLKKQLPGRSQQIAEQVLGPARAKEANAYLFGNLNQLLKAIDIHDIASSKYISEATKGSLDEQIQAARNTLNSEEQTVTKVLNKLLKDVQEDAFNVGDMTKLQGLEEVGKDIIQTLQAARGQVIGTLGKKYDAVDTLFEKLMVIPANASKEEQLIAEAIRDTIGRTQARFLQDGQNILKQYVESNPAYKIAGAKDPDINANLVSQVNTILTDMEEQALLGKLTLRQVRNAHATLKDYAEMSMVPTQLRRTLIQVLNKLDDRRTVNIDDAGMMFEGSKGADSIFTALETQGEVEFARKLAETLKTVVNKTGTKDAFTIEASQQKVINEAIKSLRDANRLSAQLLEPFDRLAVKNVIEQGGKGATNADEVYLKLVEKGKAKDLSDLFRNLRSFDEYKRGIGQASSKEQELKSQLRKRLFSNAARSATDTSGPEDVIDFTAFARTIKKFEGENQGKLLELFQDAGGGRSTGKLVLDSINQLAKLKPNLKPAEMNNLVNNFTTANKGLSGSNQGVAFVQQLSELAKASEKKLIFEANKAIVDLPNKGVEETVQAIFRPRSGSNIQVLRETLKDTPEVFKEVQQASMQKLLSKSIDFNYNGKGNITDIFKPGQLKSALDTYGDETLEAMFGREVTQGLKDFQRYIDLSTVGEIGRGGAAGGLVAAGIAAGIVFAPLATLPTLAGLAVMRQLFSSPGFVGLMLKTDKGSISQAIQMARRAAGLAGVRYINGEAEVIGSEVEKVTSKAVNEAEEEGVIDQIKKLIRTTTDKTQDAASQAQQSLRTTQAPAPSIPLPDVSGTQMPTTSPLSQDRLALDEQLFGRPSRLG